VGDGRRCTGGARRLPAAGSPEDRRRRPTGPTVHQSRRGKHQIEEESKGNSPVILNRRKERRGGRSAARGGGGGGVPAGTALR
jgi:hypothetical protein